MFFEEKQQKRAGTDSFANECTPHRGHILALVRNSLCQAEAPSTSPWLLGVTLDFWALTNGSGQSARLKGDARSSVDLCSLHPEASASQVMTADDRWNTCDQ
jgi:hypothetical protein